MGISAFGASGIKPGVCTSTTRPSAPYEGMMIYETDTDKVLFWNGSAWRYITTPQSTEPGVWQSWTPTVTPETGTFTSIGTVTAKYSLIGKTLIGSIDIKLGTINTGAGYLQFTFPTDLTPSTLPAGGQIGYVREMDLVGFFATIWIATGTKANIQKYDGASVLANNNRLTGMFMYEVA